MRLSIFQQVSDSFGQNTGFAAAGRRQYEMGALGGLHDGLLRWGKLNLHLSPDNAPVHPQRQMQSPEKRCLAGVVHADQHRYRRQHHFEIAKCTKIVDPDQIDKDSHLLVLLDF
jgi:hypothetical protein